MKEPEYERVFRKHHKLTKGGKVSYNLKLDEEIRHQMALLHKCRGDFQMNVDF